MEKKVLKTLIPCKIRIKKGRLKDSTKRENVADAVIHPIIYICQKLLSLSKTAF